MNNTYNLKLYGWYALRYECLFGCLFARPQRQAVALLNVQPGERVFVPGAGTGMGLAALPSGADITAIDLSPAMLAQAKRNLERVRKLKERCSATLAGGSRSSKR